jgi:hypothetical protein
MKALSLIHLSFGILVVAHFAITGQFMKINYFSVPEQDTLVRMMLRANHIYILFAGLINLFLSFALDNKPFNILYFAASLILVVATVFLNISFYFDPIAHIGRTSNDLGRVMTNYSVKGILVGSGLHLLLSLWYKIKSGKSFFNI